MGLDDLATFVRNLQAEGTEVAHCHGCFDILHSGHLRHFEAARGLAGALVVTVTADEHVNKGPSRPVFPANERAELIAGLGIVDAVAVNRWPSAVETIALVKPDIFIKGQEYESRAAQVNPNFFAEKTAIEAVGGRIAFTYEAVRSSTVAFKKLTAAP